MLVTADGMLMVAPYIIVSSAVRGCRSYAVLGVDETWLFSFSVYTYMEGGRDGADRSSQAPLVGGDE